MVSMWWVSQPPPDGHTSSAAGWTFLILAGLAWVVFMCLKAQIKPLNRCKDCPKPDAEGNRTRCKKCGDKPEVLNGWAYWQMRFGIPVPRARRLRNVRHPRAVPEDW